MLAMAAVAAVAGIFLTRLLPEAARRALEEVSGDDEVSNLAIVQADMSAEEPGPPLAVAQ
jgi:hypothetical protein